LNFKFFRFQARRYNILSRVAAIKSPNLISFEFSGMLLSIDGRGIWHVWGTGEVYTGFWWENLRERDHLENLGVDGRITLKWDW
jgi:hypothetical protein